MVHGILEQLSTIGVSSGKWYWEFKFIQVLLDTPLWKEELQIE
jgi:hypothetical protein